MLESLKFNEPADADDVRGLVGRRHRLLAAGRSRRFAIRHGKAFEINSVVNAVNFCCRIGTARAKKLTTVIGLSRDELRGRADLAKKIVAAEVFHEVLPVRGDAEWNPGNFFQKKRSVRCAIGEMHVYMLDIISPEEVCEIKRIARAQLCFRARAISLLMLLDKIARPFAGCSPRVLQNFQDFLRRRVTNGGA